MRLIALPLLLSTAIAQEPPLRFASLFNRESLAGWQGDGYVAENGEIAATPDGRVLATKASFANFVFDFEFKLPPGGDTGLAIHYPGTGDPAATGLEIQIIDDTAEKHRDLKPEQTNGSLVSIAAARKGPLKPAGEWNLQRITVQGPTVTVDLNGTVILEANLDALEEKFPDHTGLKRRSGHLAITGNGDRASFRRLNIAELPPAANEAGVHAAGFTQVTEDLDRGENTHWYFFNGILKHDGRGEKGEQLATRSSFTDYTLVFDWRWGSGDKPEEQEGGIRLRGDASSEILFTGKPTGSGLLRGHQGDAPPAADLPTGEWNRTLIQVKENKATVVLNGQPIITDAALPDSKSSGPIAFPQLGSSIDFANIWIKKSAE